MRNKKGSLRDDLSQEDGGDGGDTGHHGRASEGVTSTGLRSGSRGARAEVSISISFEIPMSGQHSPGRTAGLGWGDTASSSGADASSSRRATTVGGSTVATSRGSSRSESDGGEDGGRNTGGHSDDGGRLSGHRRDGVRSN